MKTFKQFICGAFAVLTLIALVSGCNNKTKNFNSRPGENVKNLIQTVDRFIACPCKPPDSCNCLKPDVSHGHPADDQALVMLDSVFRHYEAMKLGLINIIRETEIKLLAPGETDELERDLVELNALKNKLDLFYEKLSFKLMYENRYGKSNGNIKQTK